MLYLYVHLPAEGAAVGAIEGAEGRAEGEVVTTTEGLAVGFGEGKPVGDPSVVVGIAEGGKVGPVGARVTADGRTDGKGVGLPAA